MATILLVEDDEILRLTAAHHLEQAGYTVIAAGKSNEALDEVDLGRPVDLAVIDVCMPRGQVNSLAFARMARWRRPGLPIVFITGYPEVLEAEVIQEPIFLKPVDLGQLTDKIKERLAAYGRRCAGFPDQLSSGPRVPLMRRAPRRACA